MNRKNFIKSSILGVAYLESNPSLKNKQAVSGFSMKDGLPLKWIAFIFE